MISYAIFFDHQADVLVRPGQRIRVTRHKLGALSLLLAFVTRWIESGEILELIDEAT